MAAGHGLDRPQQPVEDVAPMREHIEDQPAAGRLAIIPARPLRRGQRAVEHPPAEIEPHRQNAAEKVGLIELAQFLKSGQEQLVLHDAVLDARHAAPRRAKAERLVERLGEGLFGIDMLARGDRGRGRATRPPVAFASK